MSDDEKIIDLRLRGSVNTTCRLCGRPFTTGWPLDPKYVCWYGDEEHAEERRKY